MTRAWPLARVLAVVILVSGCAGSATIGPAGTVPPPNPVAASPSPTPALPARATPATPAPAISTPAPSPRATPTPRPSPSPACPAEGTAVTFETFTALPPECASIELAIAGWWDRRRGSDEPEGSPFGQVLRERLPAGEPEEGLDFGPWLGLALGELELDTEALEGRWTKLRVRLEQSDDHCYWAIRTDEAVSAEFPPVLTCPRHARVLAAAPADPPAAALAACPDRSAVIPVEDFVRYPRACFGGRTVQVVGWFDTHDVIGGWVDPWEIKPGWLWSLAIGSVAVLAPTSNANDPENLRLHIRPDTTLARADRNRWVVLRGHYARAAEVEACHYEFVEDWYGGSNPAAGTMDPAGARADCARAFVAESVRDGTPD